MNSLDQMLNSVCLRSPGANYMQEKVSLMYKTQLENPQEEQEKKCTVEEKK